MATKRPLCQRKIEGGLEKGLANRWNRKRIAKKAHADRGLETIWEIPDYMKNKARIYSLAGLFMASTAFSQSSGFHVSNMGTAGVITVDSHDTFYDGSDGIRFSKVALPAGATKLQFRVTGGVITDGSLQYGSADGLYQDGRTPYNFTGTKWAGTYEGVPVGATTGIDPALFGMFFSPSFSGTPADSENFRSDSGITPDPRTRLEYFPAVNQPFWIGDGFSNNNPFSLSAAGDDYIPSGFIQTFDIPSGAAYLLLGISADDNLSDNQDIGNSTSAFRVHVFDDSTATNGTPMTALIEPSVQVSWTSISNVYYQVQWSSELASNVWNDFGTPVLGNGATNVVYDTTAGKEERFFRVFLLP